MKITDLITLAENKLMALNGQMSTAIQSGDAEAITSIEALVTETQSTLDSLRGLA